MFRPRQALATVFASDKDLCDLEPPPVFGQRKIHVNQPLVDCDQLASSDAAIATTLLASATAPGAALARVTVGE
jgi:hypothetical protein